MQLWFVRYVASGPIGRWIIDQEQPAGCGKRRGSWVVLSASRGSRGCTGCGRVKHTLSRTSWGAYGDVNKKSKTAVARGRPLRSRLPSRIFDSGYGSAPSWSSVFRIPHGRRRVGSLLGRSPWMAEEAMDWWLPSSSIYFGQSRRPASIGPVSTLLECRATPRPRPSMPPSAWWSSL